MCMRNYAVLALSSRLSLTVLLISAEHLNNACRKSFKLLPGSAQKLLARNNFKHIQCHSLSGTSRERSSSAALVDTTVVRTLRTHRTRPHFQGDPASSEAIRAAPHSLGKSWAISTHAQVPGEPTPLPKLPADSGSSKYRSTARSVCNHVHVIYQCKTKMGAVQHPILTLLRCAVRNG